MRTSTTTAAFGAAALILCLTAGAGFAAPPRPGGAPGGHPSFGGGHPSFGGGHPSFGGARPSFNGGAHFTPHISAGRPAISHFSARPGISHFSGRRFTTHLGHPSYRSHVRTGHLRIGHGRVAGHHFAHNNRRYTHNSHNANNNRITHNGHNTNNNRITHNAGRVTPNHTATTNQIGAHGHNAINARNFAAHRNFASRAAFRPFMNGRWHRHHHLGWIGPLFWPYAYGDVFYYALWPYEYADYDPFWAYGYGDIYEGIFSPYSYDEYVQGPGAQARMTSLQDSVAQTCTDEAAEVTSWPIDQIQAAVNPSAQQRALLDDLGNATVRASEVIKSHCPSTVSFTPTGRLDEMQQRLEGLVEAVNIVQPPLDKFYESLSDEQKARFNDLGANSGRQRPQAAQTAQNPQAECQENVRPWPTGQIDRVVQPNDAQRTRLQELDQAAAQAADLIKAACPGEVPSTPPARLAAEGKRLQAMLAAVKSIRPKLDAFYDSLSDQQKARFNTLGRQLFAQR
jgi:hypothetical protein